MNQAIKLYESGNYIYVCRAAVGAALTSAVWQIMRLDTSSGVVITWASGTDLFDKEATDLATVQGYTFI